VSLQVEIFSSPGCGKCAHAKDILRRMAQELGDDTVVWREVNILEELDYAVELGVLSTPAIAIDGQLVFPALPSPNRLRAELSSRLSISVQGSK